jgi:hypothetical protein
MRSHHYTAAVIACILSATVSVSAFNAAMDPMNRLGFNRDGILAGAERDAKPHLIQTYPHDAVFVGSSKMGYIDPVDIDNPEYTFFNAAFAGALPEEIAGFIDLYVHNARLVVVGFDFYMMNENSSAFPRRSDTFAPKSLRQAFQYNVEYLLSWRILRSSYDRWRLRHQLAEAAWLLPSGGRHLPQELERSRAMKGFEFDRPLQTWETNAFGNFHYSEQRLDDIRRIKRTLADRGIQLVAIIPPESRSVLDLIDRMPARAAFSRFRRDLADIFPDLLDYSDSSFSNNENFLRYDPIHFLPEVGAALMQDVLKKRRSRPYN